MSVSEIEKLNNLILAIADGNADALDGVYFIAGKRMFSVALGFVGSRATAEDILHDSFLKLAKFACKYRKNTNPYSWLIKIVQNTALDYLRRLKRRSEDNIDGFYNLTSTDDGLSHKENAIMLEQTMAKLDTDEKKLIYYRYYLELNIREIAKQTGKSKSTAARAIESVEKKLKILLSGGTND